MSFIECGSCSYSCPGHVHIVQYIRAAKGQINDHKRAMAAALANSQTNSSERSDKNGSEAGSK